MLLRPLLAAMLLLLPAGAGVLHAQEAGRPGPVITSTGPVFPVPAPDVETPRTHTYRALWEVRARAAEADQVNPSFSNAARFLNMHVRAGVPLEQLRLALVVHGPAGADLLTDAAYRERFGVANPNLRAMEELAAAGVRIILCGQTAAARGLPRDALAPQVEVALSAMTAFVLLQDEGYRLIPW